MEPSVLIMGHRVAFPAGKSPFPAQLAVMSSTLAALKRRQHALVESPTGSGKTLALLSSCLTFQRDYMQEAETNDRNIKIQESEQTQELRDYQEQQQHQQQSPTEAPMSSFALVSPWDDNAFALLQRSVKRIKTEDRRPSIANITSTQSSTHLMKQETQQDIKYEAMHEFQAMKQETTNEAVAELDDLNEDVPPSVPKIYFCSRTHSQLTQAVNELKGCPESYMRALPGSTELRSCVLAAKRILCVNDEVNSDPMMVNEKCQELRMKKERRRMAGDDEEEDGCKFSQTKFARLRAQVPQVWDVEDVTKLAPACEECAYFFAKSALKTAHIIFCPYNYVLDPSIRNAQGISLQNAIVVLDEAHNVEDTCRNIASLEITDRMLASVLKSFEDVIWHESEHPSTEAYDAVRCTLSRLAKWFEINAELVRDPEDMDDDDCHVLWSAADALEMLRECKFMEISGAEIAEIVQQEQLKLTMPGSKVMLGNRALNTATKLLSVATYMFSGDCKNADDFKLLITKKMRVNVDGEEVIDLTLCIWCLKAAVVFSEVAWQSHSVILASGTLSPMDSFAGELGVDFPVRLEANHVVNMHKQVFIGALMNGPGGVDLLSTYKNQQRFQYQDSMGLLLLQYAQVIPGGILMFFPSYALMGILIARWKRTGLWAQLEKHKEMFNEPRQGGKDFDALLDRYKSVIATCSAARNTPSGWARDTSNIDKPSKTGAIFLAVYRGKVSEGIDFSDDNARAVLAVGIPFPNFRDLQVSLKREYQDDKSRGDRKLVNGSWWYKLQAFRALNQALGRCIRHRRDYGAVILIDSRHRRNMHGNLLSKWMRPHVHEFWSSEDCNPLFVEFFQRNQVEMPLLAPGSEPEPASPLRHVPAPAPSEPIVLAYEEDGLIKAEPQT